MTPKKIAAYVLPLALLMDLTLQSCARHSVHSTVIATDGGADVTAVKGEHRMKLSAPAIVDGASPFDCGPKHAVCGIWSCTSPFQHPCVTEQTACVYQEAGSQWLVDDGGQLILDGGHTADGSYPIAKDGGHIALDGGYSRGIGCAYNDTELSNSVLGSAAQQVPGGSFCPSTNVSVNTLTDRNNCGYCMNACGGGGCNVVGGGGFNPTGPQTVCSQVYCLNGMCMVP